MGVQGYPEISFQPEVMLAMTHHDTFQQHVQTLGHDVVHKTFRRWKSQNM